MRNTSDDDTVSSRHEPWVSSRTPLVHLVRLDAAVIDALADGDLGLASALSPFELSADFVEAANVRVWRFRSRQLRSSPDDAAWITRAICASDGGAAVGRAGFHGPPDESGMVEVGYSVDPAYRRQGYARAALSALLERARIEDSVRVVRASIRPDNLASRSLVAQFGFVEVGEQWDDEDGLETIYEVNALSSP
ncbi:MAG TPA: GNAT family N-acetyltransferase [Glaciibacter sp.]|nr:GNAT family N-acetyltransferase [Glaciibacter sp.]